MLFKIKKSHANQFGVLLQHGCGPALPWVGSGCLQCLMFYQCKVYKRISTRKVNSMFEVLCMLTPANTFFSNLKSSVQQVCEICRTSGFTLSSVTLVLAGVFFCHLRTKFLI